MSTFGLSVATVILDNDTLRIFQVVTTVLRVLRIFKFLRVFRLFTDFFNLVRASRYTTSQNKQRYVADGFDLDLCYITDRIIAMSFPSSGFTALYRNPISVCCLRN